jgi:hypothetical protein
MAVDGTYDITVPTPMGDQTSRLTLKTAGNTLTGTMGADALIDAKVNGNEVQWTKMESTPIGELKLDFKVTIDGDKITGEVQTPFGPNAVTGVRV